MKLKMINGAVKLGMTLGLSVLCLTSQSGICGQWILTAPMTETIEISSGVQVSIEEGQHEKQFPTNLTEGTVLYAAKLKNKSTQKIGGDDSMIGVVHSSCADGVPIAKTENGDKFSLKILNGNEWKKAPYSTGGSCLVYKYQTELEPGATTNDLRFGPAQSMVVKPGNYSITLVGSNWVD
ncbi:hypothetical protein NGB58_26425 [Escherichia coli]|nr:hypothetical protein [Escherichia coli]